MIRFGILVLPCPYRRMMSLGILLLIFVWFASILWSPAGYAVKTLYLLHREKLQLSPPRKLPVSFVFLRSSAHYLPRIWNHKLVSDVPAPRTFYSANSLLEIQATCTSMSITLTFEKCTQNSELRGMEPATKFCNWIRRSNWEYRYFELI